LANVVKNRRGGKRVRKKWGDEKPDQKGTLKGGGFVVGWRSLRRYDFTRGRGGGVHLCKREGETRKGGDCRKDDRFSAYY